VSDRYGEEVCNTFIKNMIKSQEKTWQIFLNMI
jgi:hypothetical protein